MTGIRAGSIGVLMEHVVSVDTLLTNEVCMFTLKGSSIQYTISELFASAHALGWELTHSKQWSVEFIPHMGGAVQTELTFRYQSQVLKFRS